MRRVIFPLIFLAFLASIALELVIWRDLNRPRSVPPDGMTLRVVPGMSFASITEEARRLGLVGEPISFRIWARLNELDRGVRSGEYRIDRSLTPLEFLALLQTVPAEPAEWVTFPEGYTVVQMANLLQQLGIVSGEAFLAACRDRALLQSLQLPESGPEGFLFPDTYALKRGTDPAVIVRRMVDRYREQTAHLDSALRESGMSERELVTLASIIEKETGRPEERPLISAVFRNRLRIGMPLQSDPTVIYGIANFDGNLTRAHLEDRSSPYNTYRHRGLPPGPIANPGRASIEAVLAPAESKALYFVARRDGSHEFSESLSAHNRAVNRYQRGGGAVRVP